MAAPKRSELIAGATQIKVETVPEANSAPRVGGYLEQLARSIPKQWEPTETYEANEFCFFNDAAYRAREFCDVGESPATTPEKWRSRQVNDQDLQSITDRNRITTQLIRAAGYEVPSFDDMAADDVDYLLVEKVTGDVKKIARMPLSAVAVPATKPALVLGTVPTFTAVVGVRKTVSFAANVVTAPDGAVVSYAADGPLPAGVTLDKDQRTITLNVATTDPVSINLIASTPDGRTKKFTITVTVSPQGSARFIEAIYDETNLNGSFSSFVMATVGPGEKIRQILRGKPGTDAAGYTDRVRIAATDPNGFPSYTGLFTGRANFASLWAAGNGVDDRPPLPPAGETFIYIRVTEVVGADDQPVEPPIQLIHEIVFFSDGVAQKSYPADGEVINRPPEYKQNLPGTLEVEAGKTKTGNASTLFSDYEGDTYSYHYDVPFGEEANISIDTTSGEYEVAAQAGRFAIYVLDQLNRKVSSGWCTVTVKAVGTFTIQRADYKNDRNVVGGVDYQRHYFRFKLLNVPSGATLKLERNNNLNQKAEYPLVDQSGDWFNFDVIGSDQYRNGDSPANNWAWTLVVTTTSSTSRYPIYTTRYAGQPDVTNWLTVLPTGGTPTTPTTIDEWANTATTYNAPVNGYYTDPNRFKLITEITTGGKLRLVRDDGTASADPDCFILYRIDNVNVGGVGSLNGIELEADQPVQIMKLMVPNAYVGQNNFFAQLKFARWVETAEFTNPV